MSNPTHDSTVPAPLPPPKRVTYPMSSSEVARLALDLGTTPYSVRRELAGWRVAFAVGERIRAALKAKGLPTSDGPSPAPVPVPAKKGGEK